MRCMSKGSGRCRPEKRRRVEAMGIFPIRTGEWALLTLHLPSRSEQRVGILLVDAVDGLHVRLRSDWASVARDDDYATIWCELEEDLAARGRDLGGKAVLDWLEESASHTLQIGERHSIEVGEVRRTVEEPFSELVSRTDTQTEQKEQQQKRYRVRAAIAAALIVMAVVVARRTHVPGSNRSMAVFAGAMSDRTGLLPPDFPQHHVPLLSVDPVARFVHPIHRHIRSQINARHVHRRFRVGDGLMVQALPPKTVPIEPPPSYGADDLQSMPVLDIGSSSPEPPPFRARRNRFVQFLCLMASPLKKLFSSRDASGAILD